jgi:hypothetical protein
MHLFWEARYPPFSEGDFKWNSSHYHFAPPDSNTKNRLRNCSMPTDQVIPRRGDVLDDTTHFYRARRILLSETS